MGRNRKGGMKERQEKMSSVASGGGTLRCADTNALITTSEVVHIHSQH